MGEDTCSDYNGTAAVQRTPDGLRWTQADPAIHVADVLVGDEFLLAKYAIVGPCLNSRDQHHARLRDD